VVEPAANVSPATKDEKDTVEMCTSTAGARLGCQFKVLGDIVIRPA
jgi:ferredoxin